MRNTFILILLFVALKLSSQENPNCGIIYGANHSFKLTAPTEWVLDNKSGVEQGIHAVFYKKGSSWANAVTVMYANTATLEMEGQQTLKELIDYDSKTFQNNYPGITISNKEQIEINEDTVALVKYFGSESYGNYEHIAYIDAGNIGVMIVMSSRNKKEIENNYLKFVELVKSYEYLADYNVTEEK